MSISNANSSTGTAITTSTLTTTGDILYASAANTPARLGIGSTGQVVTVASGIPSWATPAGGGKVLQVVQGTTSTGVTTTSTTYVDTGVTATITPTLNTSKVLVLISQQLLLQGTGSGGSFSASGLKVFRGATVVIDASSSSAGAHSIEAGNSGNSRVGLRGYEALNYLDSPATTSATTYKVQMAVSYSGDTLISQGNACQSSIILMEIGA